MNAWGRGLWVLVFFAACGLVLADDEVVLAGRGFVVTTEDFDRYLTDLETTAARNALIPLIRADLAGNTVTPTL